MANVGITHLLSYQALALFAMSLIVPVIGQGRQTGGYQTFCLPNPIVGSAVPSIYSSARTELHWSPVCRERLAPDSETQLKQSPESPGRDLSRFPWK